MDAWEWDVDEVVEYLCYSKDANFTADKKALEARLREGEVDGPALLEITVQEIKDDLCLTKLGNHKGLLRVINALRRRSARYQAHLQEGEVTQANGPFQAVPDTNLSATLSITATPPTDEQPAEALAIAPKDATPARPRKRARIEMVAQPAEDGFGDARVSTTAPNFENAYLPTYAVDINKFVYGAAERGQELGEQDPSSDDNIAIVSQPGAVRGYALFTKQRMHNFFNREFVPIDRERKRLVAHPYPERLVAKHKRRYITLLRTDTQSLTCRDALLLDDQHELANTEPDEWDVFIRRPYERDSSVLIDESHDDEASENQMDPENEDPSQGAKSTLSRQTVNVIIDQEIEGFMQRWREEKLPRLLSKSRSIWRKARSRIGASLVSQARNEIRHIEHRLDKMKSDIAQDLWVNEARLIKQCKILDQSVFDLCTHRWKLELWKSRAVPEQLDSQALPKMRTRIDREEDVESLVTESDSSASVARHNVVHLSADRSTAPGTPSDFVNIDDLLVDGLTSNTDEDSLIPASSRAIQDYQELDLTQQVMSPLAETAIKCEPSTKYDESAHDQCETVSNFSIDDPFEILSEDEKDGFEGSAESASLAEMFEWEIGILEERVDRKRLVLKILHHFAEERKRLYKLIFSTTDMDKIIGWLFTAMDFLAKKQQQQTETLASEKSPESAQLDFARLFATYVDADSRFWEDESGIAFSDVSINRINSVIDGDFAPFFKFLQATRKKFDVPEEPISLLSSDDDEDIDLQILAELTPKKRKRALKNDKSLQMVKMTQNRIAQDEERRKVNRGRLLAHASNISGEAIDERTVINPGAKEGEEFIPIDKHIASKIKPYQMEGVRFMWRELVTSDDTASGGLLAHAMGLGKTMQTITLLTTLERAVNDERYRSQVPESLHRLQYLVLCPATLVSNWTAEFSLWSPKDSVLHYARFFQESKTDATMRYLTVKNWSQRGGVFVMSYDTFRSMIRNKGKYEEQTHEEILAWLLQGPAIVIADEAHKLKRDTSGIGEATAKFGTLRRIALTGTPLANNTMEYFSMINWVSPGFLGDKSEFRARFQGPIEDGIKADASREAQRLSLKKLKALSRIIANKTNRASIEVLAQELKPKTEFVITLPLVPQQKDLYACFVELITERLEEMAMTRLWANMTLLALLLIDPYLFLDGVKKRAELKSAPKSIQGPIPAADAVDMPLSDDRSDAKRMVETLHALARSKGIAKPRSCQSYKLDMILRIAQLSKSAGDRLLIFSRRLVVLDAIEEMLREKNFNTTRLDGKTKIDERRMITMHFGSTHDRNDVMLISTTAGGTGLNIQGANRVILADFGFDPSQEEQAIGRAYRIGQPKHVFVYHVVIGGSFEETLHNTVIFKKQLASRVVDKKNPQRSSTNARDYIFPPRDPELRADQKQEVQGKDPAVLDKILSENLGESICGIQTAETLHAEVDEPLEPGEDQEVELMITEQRKNFAPGQPVGHVNVASLGDNGRAVAAILEQQQLLTQSRQNASHREMSADPFDAVPIVPGRLWRHTRAQHKVNSLWMSCFGPSTSRPVLESLSLGPVEYPLPALHELKKLFTKHNAAMDDMGWYNIVRKDEGTDAKLRDIVANQGGSIEKVPYK